MTDCSLPLTSARLIRAAKALCGSYPFLSVRTLARTAFGRPVLALRLGEGRARVLASAGHHANEWITSLLLLRMLGDYCQALREGGSFGNFPASALFRNAALFAVPMVDPDGVDLVTGAVRADSAEYRAARRIAAGHPEIPFPMGWKANLLGADLNLNYPASWEQAREIKQAAGFAGPAPRDWPGAYPLDQKECAALAAYTAAVRPDLVLAWHSQGGEIYDDFHGFRPPGAATLTAAFAAASGYRAAEAPADSSNAGYKDWFLQRFRRPGFTIEAGRGENPLPLSGLPDLLRENEPILALALAEE
jgi:g-D-glutamyl-meso-diaminopimelate peptidase